MPGKTLGIRVNDQLYHRVHQHLDEKRSTLQAYIEGLIEKDLVESHPDDSLIANFPWNMTLRELVDLASKTRRC